MAKKEYQNAFRELAFAGYGIVFISHSTEKTFKNDKGEEYTQIVPALPTRPFDIVNKMVDIIGYIRGVNIQNEDSTDYKRYMFLRGDDRFMAGSRYEHMVPRIELSYENLVNALYDAIDKETSVKGGKSTDAKNPYLELSYDDLMEEAKALWGRVVMAEKQQEAFGILETEFGKPTKFSDILPEQVDQLKKVISQIQDLL